MHRVVPLLAAMAALVIACGDSDPVAPPLLAEASEAGDAGPTTNSTKSATFTGNSTAINATVGGDNDIFCESGPLNRTGGSIQTNMASASIAGVLSASSLECHTGGSGLKGHSEAALRTLRITLGNNTITVGLLRSMVGTFCPTPNTPFSVGHTTVRGLVINGQTITVSSDAVNQRINIRNGTLIINEQTFFVTSFHAGRTVIGLRVIINGEGERPASNIILARSQNHIDCP